MVIRHTELKKIEQQYEKNGNQLVLLYGREGCDKEALIRIFCKGKKFFLLSCTQGVCAGAVYAVRA